MNTQKHKSKLRSVHRLALLRVAAGYCTVSYDALCVLTEVPPIELQVKGRKLRSVGMSRNEVEATIVSDWQDIWTGSQVGDWTRRLIPNIEDRIGKKRGNLDFYVTQMMTGHGSFGQYLNRIGKKSTPQCAYCQKIDNAEHTVFSCRRWERNRNEITANNITPENLISWMVLNETNWDWFVKFAGEVLRTKEEEARRQGL